MKGAYWKKFNFNEGNANIWYSLQSCKGYQMFAFMNYLINENM